VNATSDQNTPTSSAVMPRLVAELQAQFTESAKLEKAIKANRLSMARRLPRH
jgi:hypothetical protein